MYSKDKHDCPRGFHFCDEKQECIPDRGDVKDKLTVKSERYFFKENTCPDGSVWCPMRKKCIPEKEMKSMGHGKGKGFGQGKGPVGVPKKEDITMKNIDKLVDEVFDGGFNQFGKMRQVEKQVDKLISLIVKELDSDEKVDFGKDSSVTSSRPYDHPKKAKVVPTVDVAECAGPPMGGGRFEGSEYDQDAPAKEDDARKLANDLNNVPNQNAEELFKSLYDELSEAQIWKTIAEMRINENYKKYFKLMLKKHGYTSPADIPDDKKKEFFNAVDKGWKAVKEQVIRRSDPSSRGGFGSIRGSSDRGGFGSIRGTRQSGGFGSIRGRNEEDDVDDEVDTQDANDEVADKVEE